MIMERKLDMLAEEQPADPRAGKSFTMADIAIVVLLVFSHLSGLLFYGLGLRVGEITAVVQTILVCALLFAHYTVPGVAFMSALRANRWVFIWISIGVYVGAIGLICNSEFIGWVYSDLYRYFVVPIIVGLMLGTKRAFNVERIVKLMATYEVAIAIIEIFAVLSGHYPRTSNMIHVLFPYAFAILLIRGKRVSPFWSIGFVVELARIVLSLSRTLLLEATGFLILIPLLALRYRGKVAVRRIAMLSILFLALLGGMLFVNPAAAVPFEQYGRRLAQLSDVTGSISIMGRFFEAKTALAYLYDQGAIAMLLGTGAGGTYYLSEIMQWAGSGKYLATSFQVHNIHIGPVSVLFRTGIVGLILIYMPLVFIPLHLMFRAPQPMDKVIGAFLLFKTIESLQALRLVGDPFWLFILAAANYEVYLHRSRIGAAVGCIKRSDKRYSSGRLMVLQRRGHEDIVELGKTHPSDQL